MQIRQYNKRAFIALIGLVTVMALVLAGPKGFSLCRLEARAATFADRSSLLKEIRTLPLSRLLDPIPYNPKFDPRERYDTNGILQGDYSAYGKGWLFSPEAISRHALKSLNGYIHTGDHRLYDRFILYSKWIRDHLERTDKGQWMWCYHFDYEVNNVYNMKSPWGSALAQGQCIATLARAYALTGESSYLGAIKKAISSFSIEVPDGGFRRTMGTDAWWYEEYPTEPASYVLNGFVTALLALWEVHALLGDAVDTGALFKRGINALEAKLPAFAVTDEEGVIWSRYDLAPKQSMLLNRLLPPEKKKAVLWVDRIFFEIDGQAEAIDVGEDGDTNRTVSYLFYNPEYMMWGDPTIYDNRTCRKAFANEGKYGHAPFMLRLTETQNEHVYIIRVVYRLETGGPFDRPPLLQAYDGHRYQTLGIIEEKAEPGQWQEIIVSVPQHIIKAIFGTAVTKINIAKEYHSVHIALLYLLGDILGEEQRYASYINTWLPALKYVNSKEIVSLIKVWNDPNQRPLWAKGLEN